MTMTRKWGVILLLACLSAGPALAETLTGVVAEDGFGSIRMRGPSGGELRLHMQRGMVYEPSDYRALAGDKVTVTYETENRKGQAVAVIRKIELVALDPRNAALKSPVEGRIEEVGRKFVRVFIPSRNEPMTFEFTRGMPAVPDALANPKAGDEVLVYFQRVPSRFGNGYVNQLHGFQKKK